MVISTRPQVDTIVKQGKPFIYGVENCKSMNKVFETLIAKATRRGDEEERFKLIGIYNKYKYFHPETDVTEKVENWNPHSSFSPDFSEVELKNVHELVLKALETDERTRNDDKYLTWVVMRHFSPKFYIPFEDFKKICSFESIRRVRQKIQNVDKLFPPTKESVIKKREKREKVYREAFSEEKDGQ